MKVTIIDYGMGNLSSVARAFESLNAEVQVTSTPSEIENAERIVLPGVGAFGQGMRNLESHKLVAPLELAVRKRNVPFLGICLGMQLLAKESLEQGRHAGLGWIPASVRPFEGNGSLKTIHVGWDEVVPTKPSFLFKGLKRVPYFYFVHGYHVTCDDPASVAATSTYGGAFHSALGRENIAGVQFHPEKSQEAGLGLLKNFLSWNPAAEEAGTLGALKSNGKAPNIRLIPTLLYRKGRLTKTVRFKTADEGIRVDVGHPVKAPMVYDAQLADELIFLDFRATVEGRDTAELIKAISEISGRAFMPLTAGGGITKTEQIRDLLLAGADKVAINSAAVERPDLIREASRIFGNQCIVVSIDAKKKGDGSYEALTRSGTKSTGLTPVAWAKKAEALGAGEILLTSIDREGTLEGYDIELIRQVAEAVKIPVIASGGAGKLQDLAEVISAGKATAAAAASIFHFRDVSPIKAKAFLKRAGVPIRD